MNKDNEVVSVRRADRPVVQTSKDVQVPDKTDAAMADADDPAGHELDYGERNPEDDLQDVLTGTPVLINDNNVYFIWRLCMKNRNIVKLSIMALSIGLLYTFKPELTAQMVKIGALALGIVIGLNKTDEGNLVSDGVNDRIDRILGQERILGWLIDKGVITLNERDEFLKQRKRKRTRVERFFRGRPKLPFKNNKKLQIIKIPNNRKLTVVELPVDDFGITEDEELINAFFGIDDGIIWVATGENEDRSRWKVKLDILNVWLEYQTMGYLIADDKGHINIRKMIKEFNIATLKTRRQSLQAQRGSAQQVIIHCQEQFDELRKKMV